MNISKMEIALIVARVACTVCLSAVFLAGCGGSQNPTTAWAAFPESQYPYVPLITEISPFSAGTEAPWIELHNPLAKAVPATGLKVVINDEYAYSFPEGLAPVPPKGFILLMLDGEGRKKRADRYEGRTTILHAPWDLTDVMKGKPGQIAAYRRINEESYELVGFVSWGAPGSKASLTAERNRIWRAKWFVEMAHGTGDYDTRSLKWANYTIGLYPGSTKTDLGDWVIFSKEESTPGMENVVPRPAMFRPFNGAAVRSEDIAITWISTKHAQAHRFQLAQESSFTEKIEDIILEAPFYRPETALPEGIYYYRVKTIDKTGKKSPWSEKKKIISTEPPASNREVTSGKFLNPSVHRHQAKDTALLCLGGFIFGCPSHLDAATAKHWDNTHAWPDFFPLPYVHHGFGNCARASISMMVSAYNKNLSQDRIAYYTEEERPGVGNGIPEGDLAHGAGMSTGAEETAALEWALDETVTFQHVDSNNPLTFAEVKGWLDNHQPVMIRTPLGDIDNSIIGHVCVLSGYRIDTANTKFVTKSDPLVFFPQEFKFDNLAAQITDYWVGPPSAPNAREDEPGIELDTDGDGIMDFDEQVRFKTGRFDKDSDNDGVLDKDDIYEYVFDATDKYAKRGADYDNDGVRKEKDPDNDNDGCLDGAEDNNFNGKYEPNLGETDNFLINKGLTCVTKPLHTIIVFDRSGSMVHPLSDPVKKYDEAASAAVLFLDAWLVNDPPEGTQVGLVFYDNQAYFDNQSATDTTLENLSPSKRDKIKAALASNRPASGSTSIGAGLLEAMDTSGFNVPSLAAGGQNRMVIVLTDGKENTPPFMSDPTVVQKRVDGQVDGHVLGIGDPVQIDPGQLNVLADILGTQPASLATDLNQSELQKFFLQILAETQGLAFSSDPAGEIRPGKKLRHGVVVTEGTETATFIIVWHAPRAALDFTLSDPSGMPVQADVIKNNALYRLAAKHHPVPGDWTVTVSAGQSGKAAAPRQIAYNLIVLEKNDGIHSHFDARSGFYHTGQPLLLTATVSKNRRPLPDARVLVEITRPDTGLGQFLASRKLKGTPIVKTVEKDAPLTPLDSKTLWMAENGLRIPQSTSTVELNDAGMNGDAIIGDGKYSAYFNETRIDGVYKFRFMADALFGPKKERIRREDTRSVLITPRVDPATTRIRIQKSRFSTSASATQLNLSVMPLDGLGNKIGPGHTDIIRGGIRQGEIINILDKADGTYEVELKIQGKHDAAKIDPHDLFGRPKF